MKQLDLFGVTKVPKSKKSKETLVEVKELPILVRPEWPYEYITEVSRLVDVYEDLKRSVVLGFDIETLGLDPYQHAIRLIQLSRPGKTYILDYGKLGTLGPVESLLRGGGVKVGHYLKFELKMFRRWFGFFPEPIFCTMTADRLIKAGQQKRGFRLYDIVLEYLGIELDKAEQKSDWGIELSERQLVYAALDSECPTKMHSTLVRQLNHLGLMDAARLEFELIPAIVDLELAGIKVDREKWYELAVINRREHEELELQMRDMVDEVMPGRGLGFNFRSPVQVKELLAAYGLNVTSTSVDNIKKFQKKIPLIGLLLKYRELQTRISTFGESFLDNIHSATGRIHSEFDPIGTDTGRYACSSPNLMNIPHKESWRSCFIPEEGFIYSIGDYSQIELRIAACVAPDAVMLAAYKSGIDLHRLTAATVYGCNLEDVTKEQRQAAKSLNFGLVYGMSADTLRTYARNNYGVDMSEGQAKEYRFRFFKKYSGLRNWHNKTYEALNRDVVEIRTASGRLRKWADQPPWVSHLLNTPVQGSAADGMKKAHILLHKALEPYGEDARIVNVVHDEFVIETRKELAMVVKQLHQQCMIEGMMYFIKDVPIEVEVSLGQNWAAK